MKASRLVVAVLVAALLLGSGVAVGTVFAQDDNPPQVPVNPDQPFFGRGPGRWMAGGMMFADGDHPLHEYLVAAFAEALGIDPTELETRLEGGETMIEIALSTGMSQEDALALMQDAHQAALEAAQADGVELPAAGRQGRFAEGDCLMDGGMPFGGRHGMGAFGRAGLDS